MDALFTPLLHPPRGYGFSTAWVTGERLGVMKSLHKAVFLDQKALQASKPMGYKLVATKLTWNGKL